MAKKKAKKIAEPKTLGAVVDALYEARVERLALSKQVDAIKARERVLSDRLINELPKSDAQGVTGKLARATIKVKDVATVKDWSKFYKYILRKKDFSLMQRRIANASALEQIEAGDKIPGVETFPVVTVSCTKK